MQGKTLYPVVAVIDLNELAQTVDCMFRGLVVERTRHQQLRADRRQQQQMPAAFPCSRMSPGGVDQGRQGKPDDVIDTLDVHLPVPPPTHRVGLSDLGPGAEVTGIRIGDIKGTKVGHAIRDRRLDIGGNRHVAGPDCAQRFGVDR